MTACSYMPSAPRCRIVLFGNQSSLIWHGRRETRDLETNPELSRTRSLHTLRHVSQLTAGVGTLGSSVADRPRPANEGATGHRTGRKGARGGQGEVGCTRDERVRRCLGLHHMQAARTKEGRPNVVVPANLRRHKGPRIPATITSKEVYCQLSFLLTPVGAPTYRRDRGYAGNKNSNVVRR